MQRIHKLASKITFKGHSLLSSLSLLETDYKCDDYGRDSGYCKHCSESAFDKSNDEEMSELDVVQRISRPREKNQGKEGGKLPPPATKNNGKCN